MDLRCSSPVGTARSTHQEIEVTPLGHYEVTRSVNAVSPVSIRIIELELELDLTWLDSLLHAMCSRQSSWCALTGHIGQICLTRGGPN
jgi:hypothetical protein